MNNDYCSNLWKQTNCKYVCMFDFRTQVAELEKELEQMTEKHDILAARIEQRHLQVVTTHIVTPSHFNI